MSALRPDELAIVSALLGAEIARADSAAIAASFSDLRAGLPEFRRIAAELIEQTETIEREELIEPTEADGD